jgi:hypothetical protein
MVAMTNLNRKLRKFKFAGFLSVFLMTGLTACEWGSIGYNKGYAPDQPLPFSHELHAGNYKVPCLYCHSGVQLSKTAPVPSLNICMNCHQLVGTQKENIKKLAKAYGNGEPIEWVNVHMLPDFVQFNHKAHVQRFGEVESCKKCHGPVETMTKVYQYAPLSMGWCVDCHRANNAPLNCSTCHY